jgi:hypothetical protein
MTLKVIIPREPSFIIPAAIPRAVTTLRQDLVARVGGKSTMLETDMAQHTLPRTEVLFARESMIIFLGIPGLTRNIGS